MKKILTLGFISASLLIAGTPIHDKMDNRLKGKSFGGTLDDNTAAEDGLGMMIVQHHSGTTDTNNELIVQKVVSNVVRSETDSTKTIDTLSGILAGTVGSLTDKTLVQTASSSSSAVSGPIVNANPQTVTTPNGTYTFPNGYVTPPIAYNSSDVLCTGWTGTTTLSNSSGVNCTDGALTALPDAFYYATSIGSSWFEINGTQISTLKPLSNLVRVPRHLRIANMSKLTTFEGLENLTSLGFFEMYGMNALEDISALRNITSISTAASANTQSGYYMGVKKNYTVKLPADAWLCSDAGLKYVHFSDAVGSPINNGGIIDQTEKDLICQ